jgi:hypothetical protein
MTSLVLQLQADCLDSNVSILEVLRKALVVARKLSLGDAQTWIQKELGRYKSGDDAPPHRIIVGQIVAGNPYNGWIPVIFRDARDASYRSRCVVGQAIGALEDLAKSGGETLQFPFDAETQQHLMTGLDSPLQPTRHVSRAAVVGIIGATRTLVLDWCLDLERDGILGEGLTFTAKEKETASSANYTINYNGPVGNSQVQQNTETSAQSISISQIDLAAVAEFLDSLTKQLPDLQLNEAENSQLRADIEAAASQVKAPRPSVVVLRECLRSVRNILEGCTGSLLASGLLTRFPGMFS